MFFIQPEITLLVCTELGSLRRSILRFTNKKPPPFGEGFLFGGAKRDRTADLNTARVALSQLSYSPDKRMACGSKPRSAPARSPQEPPLEQAAHPGLSLQYPTNHLILTNFLQKKSAKELRILVTALAPVNRAFALVLAYAVLCWPAAMIWAIEEPSYAG